MALPQLITRDDIETGISRACCQCAHPDAGFFGPGSITWQLLRENITVLSQGRILVLALANSRLSQLLPSESDAIQRLQHSHRFLMKVVFGNQEQAMMTLSDQAQRRKTLFDVRESETLLYAITAWMDSCLAIYQAVIGPLTTALEERLFEETMLLAEIMGIREEKLPSHWHAYRHWWQQQQAQTRALGNTRRQLGNALIRSQGFPNRVPFGSYSALASFTVPPSLVEAFDLAPANLTNHRRYQRQLQRLMDTLCHLPDKLRYQPVYYEARERLQGRARAGLATRLLNRWWSGESELVSSGWSMPKADRLPRLSI